MINFHYLKGLDDSAERYELSEAIMFHEYMIVQFVKEENIERAIELAGSMEQLVVIIAKRFIHDYEHLDQTLHYHQNNNNHWLSWGHCCYSDFEVFAQERLPQMREVIDYNGKDWILKAVKFL